jgi:hypothetical protein
LFRFFFNFLFSFICKAFGHQINSENVNKTSVDSL